MAKFLGAAALTLVICVCLVWFFPWFKSTLFVWHNMGFAPVFFVGLVGLPLIYAKIK